MTLHHEEHQLQRLQGSALPLTLAFSAINVRLLSLVGGKGANLGELTRAGFPVPEGFCVTTVAYDLISQGAGVASLLDELATVRADDNARLEHYAKAVRDALEAVALPIPVVEALRTAYHDLTHDEPFPVAVRSSATAEDLPFASFAGSTGELSECRGN